MTDLTKLSGLGQKSAEKLAHLGIYSQADLLLHLPYRYQDKRSISTLDRLEVGHEVVFRGVVREVKPSAKQLICVLETNQGRTFSIRFFNYTQYMRTSFVRGYEVECFGEMRIGRKGPELFHPEYKILSLGQPSLLSPTLTPVYHTTGGIFQANIAKWVKEAITEFNALNEASEFKRAINAIHFPSEDIQQLLEFRHPLQEYLITEELASRKLLMLRAREHLATKQSYALQSSPRDIAHIISQLQLPFALTNAQHRVVQEILADMRDTTPMRRLLQGDVGSGKTIVCIIAALVAVAGGKQVVLMAPTTILAKQHFDSIAQYLERYNSPIQVVYLSSKLTSSEKKQVQNDIATGADIIVGTHALITDEVEYRDIGLVLIDEQHKFGVAQRIALHEKARVTPHQLLVSATPIPRSLVMSAYGELDVSVIDELPKGRTSIHTVVMNSTKKRELIQKLHSIIASKQQVYWVCSLIEDSEQYNAQAATTTYTELVSLLPDARIALVHSKISAETKQHIMSEFKMGNIDILVATTVIEVGVDVPNASCMVIENAEKMGLSTLHQLRGRVGRGALKSTCILLYQTPLSKAAQSRLHILRESNDGFVIAQKDLELRGAGEVLGTAQSGGISFKIANIIRDERLMKDANTLAKQLYSEQSPLVETLIERWTNAENRAYLMS